MNIWAAVVFLVLIFLNVTVKAESTIHLDNIIDIPDRTITYQGIDYKIQDMGLYDIGEPVNISVNVTDIQSFQIALLDNNENFLWNNMVYHTDGHEEMTMPGNVITTPGTYFYVVFYRGDMLAFKPVVFSKYKMSMILQNTTVSSGGTFDVKIYVTPDTRVPIKSVLSKNSSSLEFVANRTSDGEYETTIKIPYSASGTFTLYADIQSNNTTLGYPEILGASNGVIINVTNSPPPVVPSTPFVPVPMVILSIFLAALVFKKVRS